MTRSPHTDLAALRDKGGSPAEINDIRRLDEAIYQRKLEVSRLQDRRRAIVQRIVQRRAMRLKRAR